MLYINSQFKASLLLDLFYVITMSLSLLFLFITTFTDPGIIPREDLEESRSVRNMFLATEEFEVDHVALVGQTEVHCMKCRTCNIYRPPRSFHCSDCHACIEVHDHHCPWVGTCVGKRNHRFFLLFGIFTLIHALFTLSLDISFIVMFADFNTDTVDPTKVISMVLTVFTTTIVCCVGGLSCYHGRLALTNATTNEELRGKLTTGNPYNKGYSHNCRAFCYGGTSRLSPGYNVEIAAAVEPSVFLSLIHI